MKAFAKGLVHDLGKLVLIYSHPEKAAGLYGPDEGGRGHASPRSLEQEVFGCDHTEAGAWAAFTLELPDPLLTIAGKHHDESVLAEPEGTSESRTGESRTGESRTAESRTGGPGSGKTGSGKTGSGKSSGRKRDRKLDLRVVRAANLLVKTVSSEFSGLAPNGSMISWEDCAEDPVWSCLQVPGAAGQPLHPETLREELRDETILYTRFFLDLPDVRRLSQFG